MKVRVSEAKYVHFNLSFDGTSEEGKALVWRFGEFCTEAVRRKIEIRNIHGSILGLSFYVRNDSRAKVARVRRFLKDEGFEIEALD